MSRRIKPSVTTEDHLKANHREALPRWLAERRPGDAKPPFGTLMSSHVVFYPGSGTDGEPVRIFNQSRSAHVFLYVDWGISREQLDAALKCRYFTGYHPLERCEYSTDEIAPANFTPHADITGEVAARARKWDPGKPPFCRLEIMERDADREDGFGAKRLAFIFLCADALAAYEALFAGGTYPAPFAVLLHDYGFGGNYDKFGAFGLLEECAINSGALPELLLVAHYNTDPWRGYYRIESIRRADAGGDRIVPHDLYRRF